VRNQNGSALLKSSKEREGLVVRTVREPLSGPGCWLMGWQRREKERKEANFAWNVERGRKPDECPSLGTDSNLGSRNIAKGKQEGTMDARTLAENQKGE